MLINASLYVHSLTLTDKLNFWSLFSCKVLCWSFNNFFLTVQILLFNSHFEILMSWIIYSFIYLNFFYLFNLFYLFKIYLNFF